MRIRRMGTGAPPTWVIEGVVPSEPSSLAQPITLRMTTLIRSLVPLWLAYWMKICMKPTIFAVSPPGLSVWPP